MEFPELSNDNIVAAGLGETGNARISANNLMQVFMERS
jgi:hypothetical protein